MSFRSFKPEFILRTGTPPPIRHYVEPISPLGTGTPAAPSFLPQHSDTKDVNGAAHNKHPDKIHKIKDEEAQGNINGNPLDLSGNLTPNRPNSAQDLVQRSPIEALANLASSLNASPVFAPPSRRPSHSQLPPSNLPSRSTAEYGTNYASINVYGHETEERPTKRARSELYPSPQKNQGSRPATSYNGASAWSCNVEQMVDSRTRMYQDQPPIGYPLEENSALGKRLSDAQLLLDFQRGSATAASLHVKTVTLTNGHPQSETSSYDRPAGITDHQDLHLQTLADRSINQHNYGQTNSSSSYNIPNGDHEDRSVRLEIQTHTPPEESYLPVAPTTQPETSDRSDTRKTRGQQRLPKGRPRGGRSRGSSSRKASNGPGRAKDSVTPLHATDVPDQLQSPQSLPADMKEADSDPAPASNLLGNPWTLEQLQSSSRRYSASGVEAHRPKNGVVVDDAAARASSVPTDNGMTIINEATIPDVVLPPSSLETERVTTCAGCHFSSSSSTGDIDNWIGCDGCKEWFHFACAGFKNVREIRSVDKFFCRACKPKHGPTTFLRKSNRAHTSVDYASLDEGVVRTSDDNPEHHYIQPIKDGSFKFLPENFPRMRPELITIDFFERSGGFNEPIVIPAWMNPRSKIPGLDPSTSKSQKDGDRLNTEKDDYFDYEYVPDDGQDKLDMVIPHGLTVRRVAELYGPDEPLEVIDVKSQEGEDKRWTLRRWVDYYEKGEDKPILNVLSLEVSRSKLGRLIRRPKVVRDLDLQDSVWPHDAGPAPKVQFYCLMSVADCFTDFHVDFGGSSVYYHILKGNKTFFFIPPKKQHLKKYEEWCRSPAQNWTFLGDQTKECYRIDLSAGDTMLIPSGWIHAVWTPTDSLVIGGNFLTRLHYDMQIRVAEIEKATNVARKFRYPYFQKVLWYTVLKYLEDDPLPPSVAQLFYEGDQFHRDVPIHLEFNKFGHNSDLGPERYNARYYSKAELDGLPELTRYIFRTVMISLGRVEGVTMQSRNAVSNSIPKGRGDPLEIVKTFAMWTAWKRGNEDIPQWAHPDALLPDVGDSQGEKKLSASALKKLERKQFMDAYRVAPDRQSARQRDKALATGMTVSQPPDSSPVQQKPILVNGKHLSTPKTSTLGPKRIACDACRRRRIRCKHKDELATPQSVATLPNESSPGLIDANGQTDNSRIATGSAAISSVPSGVAATLPSPQMSSGLPIPMLNGIDMSPDAAGNRPGRTKACFECRKSKRRCIHDENGNIDPKKAQEAPIPRGSAQKKRRVSDEHVGQIPKKVKQERAFSMSAINPMGGDLPPLALLNSAIDVAPPIDPALSEPVPPPVEAIEAPLENEIIDKPDEALTEDVAIQLTPVTPKPETINETSPTANAIVASIENNIEVPLLQPLDATTENPHVSSPLTDISHSPSPDELAPSPVPITKKAQRHSSRPSKPVDRFSIEIHEHTSPTTHTRRASITQHTPRTTVPPVTPSRPTPRVNALGSTHQNKLSPVSNGQTRNSAKKEGRNIVIPGLKQEKDIKSGDNGKSGKLHVTEDADQASLKLARELQEMDWGLRRRSK